MNIPAHTYFYVQGQRYFLRFQLYVFMVPCSFDDLKTVYREACQQSGLLENDRRHNEAETEADDKRSPSALRSLFAVILTMYEPSDSFQLWTAHQENLCEPLTRPTDGYFASLRYISSGMSLVALLCIFSTLSMSFLRYGLHSCIQCSK